MQSIAKLAADTFINNLESRPRDFVSRGRRLTDTKTGLDYWVGNGWLFFSGRENGISFGLFWNKIRAWRAYRRWSAGRQVFIETKENNNERE